MTKSQKSRVILLVIFWLACALLIGLVYVVESRADVSDSPDLASLQMDLSTEKVILENINLRFQLNDIQIKQLQAQQDALKRNYATSNNKITALESQITALENKLEATRVPKDETVKE